MSTPKMSDNFVMFYVANPNKYRPPEIKRIKGTRYWDIENYNLAKKAHYICNPEMRVCHGVSLVCPKLFKDADVFCANVYQHYGLLDKNEHFNEEPDIYCVVSSGKEIVGTLGYSWNNLPIRKTYLGLDEVKDNAHELMRMSIKPGLGLRTEIISKKIVEMRNEKHLWENKKHVESIGDFYRKSSSMTSEVGLLLFKGMLTFYRTIAGHCGYTEPPPLWISTHGIIENFFNKILKKNIFKKNPKIINWNSIPKKSWNAYLMLDFNPYEIMLNEIAPELFLEKEKIQDAPIQLSSSVQDILKKRKARIVA